MAIILDSVFKTHTNIPCQILLSEKNKHNYSMSNFIKSRKTNTNISCQILLNREKKHTLSSCQILLNQPLREQQNIYFLYPVREK